MGDANLDRRYDQLDIVNVLQSAKYLTGQPATWSEGDWTGDGLFDQLDIVAWRLQSGHYLQGPYAERRESDASLDTPSDVNDANQLLANIEENLQCRCLLPGSSDALGSEAVVGDVNADGRFDQVDLLQVLESGKYAMGEPATWTEGDWSGTASDLRQPDAIGDGLFDSHDIVASLRARDTRGPIESLRYFSGSSPEDTAGDPDVRTILFLLVQMGDLLPACSVEKVQALMFTNPDSVQQIDHTSSHGQLWWNGLVDDKPGYDIYEVTLEETPEAGPNDWTKVWHTAADERAAAKGIDLSQYQHIVYILPNVDDLGLFATGYASRGLEPTPARAVIAACSTHIIAHELGHNFSLADAGTDFDNDRGGDISLRSDFGDFSSPMGVGRKAPF